MKMIGNVLGVVAVMMLAGAVSAQPADPAKPATQPATQPAEPKKEEPKQTPANPAAPVQPETKPATEPKAAEPAKEQFVYVTMKTTMGEIVLELNQEKAPLSVANFLAYVDKGHYEGTIFHRVIKDFMIQGGGFDMDMKQKPTDKPIKNEWKNGLKNARGTIACARTPVADSATTQFFINVKDNTFLDDPRDGAAYAVFGRVVQGIETVDAIRGVKTGIKGGMGDVPVETVKIEKVSRLTKEQVDELKKAGEKK